MVALDKNFHMKCYKCEVGVPLAPRAGWRWGRCPCLPHPDAPITVQDGGWAFCGVTEFWINQERVTSGRGGCCTSL